MVSKLSDSSRSSDRANLDDTCLQECFVLRRVTSSNNLSDTASSRRGTKAKRKAECDEKSLSLGALSDHVLPPILKDESLLYCKRRMDAFCYVWTQIEKNIKDVLSESNNCTFEEIRQWIGGLYLTRHGNSPVVKQLPTALVFTRNVEFVDDRDTFQQLCTYLKRSKCHIASLPSNEFSTKTGLGGCVRSILRQLVKITPDTPDMEILASWHQEPANSKKPVVIVLEDVERCKRSILAEFVKLLSEWVVWIPVILVMGMATTVDALRKMLPSNAVQHLHPERFNLTNSLERLEAVITAISVQSFGAFFIGHRVARFLYNFFTKQDGTLTSFSRALKIACMEHFCSEPLSFLCKELMDHIGEEELQSLCESLPASVLKHATGLPSVQLQCISEDREVSTKLSTALLEIQRTKKNWSQVLLCLIEAGKHTKVELTDLFYDVFCPSLNSKIENGKSFGTFGCANGTADKNQAAGLISQKIIAKILKKIRDCSSTSLAAILKRWGKIMEELPEVIEEIKWLQSLLGCEITETSVDASVIGSEDRSNHRAHVYENSTFRKADPKMINDLASRLLQKMAREYLRPIESMPFHEILCYKQVDTLESALLGDTRKTIQADLVDFQKSLQCSCCRGKTGLYSSMHDTSLVYNLAQEHGDVINVHDCYESFRAIISENRQTKNLERQKSEKRIKSTAVPLQAEKAVIQARFSKAILELQIAGLLRMPSKRRPDFIQRVAFGS